MGVGDRASWAEALRPYLHHAVECSLAPCTCGLSRLAAHLGITFEVGPNEAVLEMQALLADRESLAAEWTSAQLLARLSLPDARTELARNAEWLTGQGYSVALIQVLADGLRSEAVRRGADPDFPGPAAIDRLVRKLGR